MPCLVCGREKIWHGSEHRSLVPGSYLIETGCHDGVRMDDDEYHEGWQGDVIYPPCPHSPLKCRTCNGNGECPEGIQNDSDDCPHCNGTGWKNGECKWPDAVSSETSQEGSMNKPGPSGPSPAASVVEALRLLTAEDQRQTKLHELLETIREQIRLEIKPEHRPDGLFKNIQDAVYAMRGRMPLMNDAAITSVLYACTPTPSDTRPEVGADDLVKWFCDNGFEGVIADDNELETGLLRDFKIYKRGPSVMPDCGGGEADAARTERVIEALSRFHRNSCYPEATTGELEIGAAAIAEAMLATPPDTEGAEAVPFGWFEPVTPKFGGSLIERFRKVSDKPPTWTINSFPLYTHPPRAPDRASLKDFIAAASYSSGGALDSDTIFCEIYTPGYPPKKKGSFAFHVEELRAILALISKKGK